LVLNLAGSNAEKPMATQLAEFASQIGASQNAVAQINIIPESQVQHVPHANEFTFADRECE
jgi:hypothetical protein